MGTLSEIIGSNVERLRKLRGLNQEDFGKLCVPVINQSRLSQLESGKKTIKISTIEQLATALGVEPFELLIDRSKESFHGMSAMLGLIQKLPKKERESLTRTIEAVLKNNGLIG